MKIGVGSCIVCQEEEDEEEEEEEKKKNLDTGTFGILDANSGSDRTRFSVPQNRFDRDKPV